VPNLFWNIKEMEFKNRELLPIKAGFDPRSLRVTLMVNKRQWHRLFPEYLRFPQKITFHQYSILIFIVILIFSEGQAGEIWQPSKNKCSD